MGGEEAGTFTIQELLRSGAITAHKDGNYGSNYPRVEEFVAEGVPFLTAKSLRGGKIDFDGAPRLSYERADQLRFGFIQPGDVLLSHNATIGRVAVVPDFQGRALVGTSLTYFRVDSTRISPRYLAAYFSSEGFQSQLAAVMSHSTRNQVPVSAQRRLHVVVPSLKRQDEIGTTLSTLDARIDLSRAMSETLESMARVLFKSWFVDFDPVRAKAEGRETGLPAEIEELFPDGFEESEVGEIPLGWRTGTLGDIAIHPRASVKPEEISSEAAYIALEHMPQRSISLGDWGRAEGIESNKHEFRRGDILFGKLRPYFHKVGVAPIDGVCSTDIVVVRPSAPHWFALVLGHASSDAFVNYTNSGSTGTKMPRTSWNEMSRYQLVVPPVEVSEALSALVRRYVDRIIGATHESRALISLRDALLPRLLSGAYSSAISQ